MKLFGQLHLWLLTGLLSTPLLTHANGDTMLDLTTANEYQKWRETNDNVMGGISQGAVGFDGETSLFSGSLSLENFGGFSSANRSVGPLSADTDKVRFTFVGDGRDYQLRLTTYVDGYRINYKHDFATVAGQQQRLTFKLNDFQAVFRGRVLRGAPELEAQDIQQVGVLIADKKPGPFALKLHQLEFASSQDSQ